MRGIVTLASALAIPLLLADGSAFPFRSLVLFEAFTVIIFTLVFQGLSLPYLIKKSGASVPGKEERENSELVTHLAGIALVRIMDNYGEEALGCAPFRSSA